MTEVLSIKGIGFQALKQNMINSQEGLKKRKATNAKAVILVDRWIQKNFKQEGDPVGGWDDLEPVTLRTRRKGGKGAKILQDTGQLKTNWKHFWNSRIGRIRSGTPYAKYHDSDKPSRKLPRRQILPDQKHIEKDMVKLYDKFVGSTVRR